MEQSRQVNENGGEAAGSKSSGGETTLIGCVRVSAGSNVVCGGSQVCDK